MASLLIVATQRWHGHWTGDGRARHPGKQHRGAPPRIGLLALAVGVAAGLVLLTRHASGVEAAAVRALLAMTACSLPAVLLGLAEDLTQRISPMLRLMGALASAAVALVLMGDRIDRADVAVLDGLLTLMPLSVLLTLAATAGFTHAMNLVDGLNGLAGGIALALLLGTAVVAHQWHDAAAVRVCVVLAASLAGVMLLNYPRGLIFLGDGGAYFLGFMLVQVWLWLLQRHPTLSPWFFVALGAYPTMETLFSIYRRRFRLGRSRPAMRADRLHLHSLWYRRRARPLAASLGMHAAWAPNALGGLVLTLAAVVPMALALCAPTRTGWQMGVLASCAALYIAAFRRLVRPGLCMARDTAARHASPSHARPRLGQAPVDQGVGP